MPLIYASALPGFAGPPAQQRLRRLCALWERRAAPRLSPEQLAHLRRFPPSGDALLARASRLLARLLAARALPGGARLGMDAAGRPRVFGAPGWEVAFSHSGRAAFCLVRPPEETRGGAWGRACGTATVALDAEALSAHPPADRAFAGPARSPRASLRRWTLAEALFKALGGRPALWAAAAAAAHAGAGQRAGAWQWEGQRLDWRRFSCPGHMLCVALPGVTAAPVRLRWLAWHAFA